MERGRGPTSGARLTLEMSGLIAKKKIGGGKNGGQGGSAEIHNSLEGRKTVERGGGKRSGLAKQRTEGQAAE